MNAGRINKLFGTGGSVQLSLYAAFPDDFALDTPLLVTIDGLEVPLYCERFERRGMSGALVTFADFDTERRAQELLGREFRLAEGATTEESDDEFYMEDLIGFAVKGIEVRHDGAETPFAGTLTDYFDSEANPLFEVSIGERQILVPAVEDFISHIDFKKKKIKMVLPEGLLTL